MRHKKLLSTVMASALAVTTMAMPVMAAEQTGSVDVDISTKNGILRVEVPTKVAMTIDQFEITQTGAQIASTEFDMKNKSEMDVQVDVTSAATLGSGINLVASVDAAKKSTGNDVWLATAAQTKAPEGSPVAPVYDDASTADKVEKYYDLTEANANVATFDSTEKKAKQTFYLGKASGNAEYKLMVSADTKATVAAAQFFLLTEDTTITDNTTLQTAVDAKDVYVIVAADVTKDGTAVTKIAKGTEDVATNSAYVNTNKYYTAGDTAATSITASTPYVYSALDTAAADGNAGFRYIGKLSNGKATWTENDITGVAISYKITGISGTKYTEVKDDCTYGLYKEKPQNAAPSISTKSYQMTANTPIDIAVDLGAGELGATAVKNIMDPTGAWDYLAHSNQAVYDAANKKITLKAEMVDACISGNVTSIKVIFNDSNNTTIPVSLTQ